MAANGQSHTLDCDLLVIGGGAAGLSGAVTAAYHGLRVIVAEKASVLGGATSWSGGWMWVPLNPLSQADGIVEDIDAPRTYLKHALGENYDEPRVEALLDNGRHMVAFFENHTALQFVSGSWIADIQGDLPGAGTGGRSVGPKPINMRRIKKRLRTKLRPQLYETSLLGLGIMAGPDLQAFLHATTSVKGFFHAGWRVTFHVFDLATNRQGMQLVNGTALIARLAKSADDLGVPFAHEHAGQRGYSPKTAPSLALRWPLRTGRSPSALGAASFLRRAVSPTTSRVVASCSREPRRDGSTGPSRRQRRPETGSRSASRQAACSTRRWHLLPRGVRCRWCPTAADGSAPTHTSSTEESPVSSPSCRTASGSSTKPTATTSSPLR